MIAPKPRLLVDGLVAALAGVGWARVAAIFVVGDAAVDLGDALLRVGARVGLLLVVERRGVEVDDVVLVHPARLLEVAEIVREVVPARVGLAEVEEQRGLLRELVGGLEVPDRFFVVTERVGVAGQLVLGLRLLDVDAAVIGWMPNGIFLLVAIANILRTPK